MDPTSTIAVEISWCLDSGCHSHFSPSHQQTLLAGQKPSGGGPSKTWESSQFSSQHFFVLSCHLTEALWLKLQGSLQHHATLGDRVDYLEKLMGDSADKHTNELGQAGKPISDCSPGLSCCLHNTTTTFVGPHKAGSATGSTYCFGGPKKSWKNRKCWMTWMTLSEHLQYVPVLVGLQHSATRLPTKCESVALSGTARLLVLPWKAWSRITAFSWQKRPL